MTTPEPKPLLTREDLPLDAIAEICQRWGVREMAVDPSQVRPPPDPDYALEKNPFVEVDLYLIADFGPGKRSWGFKKHHFDVVEDLYNLLGCHVWIMDKEILEMHITDGVEWAWREMEGRDVIYTAG
ncbi:MAG: hypothetical protein OXL37_07215 [Chloroflexota bacterium]|nr:hypothetical protein [Chloroflexota bacterium]MDE2958987.1 hypothetical protein [Chloroflexota bacterium]